MSKGMHLKNGSGCGYGTVGLYPVIYLVKVRVLIMVMVRNMVRVSAITGVRVSRVKSCIRLLRSSASFPLTRRACYAFRIHSHCLEYIINKLYFSEVGEAYYEITLNIVSIVYSINVCTTMSRTEG